MGRRATLLYSFGNRSPVVDYRNFAGVRQTREGQQTKMGMVYEYLVGPRFRQRVEAIVERFTEMHEDLDKERRT